LIVGLKEIFVDENFCWLTQELSFASTQGILIRVVFNSSDIPYPRKQWIDGEFIFPCCWCPQFMVRPFIESVRHGLLPVFPKVTVDSEALYLYMRGGPTGWGTNVHQSYGQPPCDYYLQVMRKFKKVHVIGDFMNPCVNISIRAGAIWEEYDDQKNFALLIMAKYVVLASSSRSHAILELSPVWKRFWMFDQAFERRREYTWWKGYTPLEFGDGENCVASEEFRHNTVSWYATKTQIDFIVNSTCTFRPVECFPDIICPPTRPLPPLPENIGR
jgi:hypothetical protein